MCDGWIWSVCVDAAEWRVEGEDVMVSMSIRLVLLPRSVGTAILFMDIVPVKLATLEEYCMEKGIPLKHPCIPTLS